MNELNVQKKVVQRMIKRSSVPARGHLEKTVPVKFLSKHSIPVSEILLGSHCVLKNK